MNRPTVLSAVDFSEPSRQALQYAAAQARAMHARLVIVHVRELPALTGERMLYSGVPFETREELEARLRRIVPETFDGPVEHHVLEGDPVRALIDFAREQQANLIVLATHGRTGLMRVLMGSVAEQVVRRAPCPVLVVKQPA